MCVSNIIHQRKRPSPFLKVIVDYLADPWQRANKVHNPESTLNQIQLHPPYSVDQRQPSNGHFWLLDWWALVYSIFHLNVSSRKSSQCKLLFLPCFWDWRCLVFVSTTQRDMLTYLFQRSEGSWPASEGPEEVCICEFSASNQPSAHAAAV